MSEKRFSGSDMLPNWEQLMWTFYNTVVDTQGLDALDAEDIDSVSDHFLYDLAQHMPLSEIARKFYNTTEEEIKERLERFSRERNIVLSKIYNKNKPEVF